MSLFNWKPEYSVNEATLDDQHQQLFSLLNSIYENIMNSREVDSVLPKIDRLSEVTNSHFLTEERCMRETGVPDIDIHIAQHREFTQKIKTLRLSYHDNDLEVTRELMVVLGEWLLGHVIKDDRKNSARFKELSTTYHS